MITFERTLYYVTVLDNLRSKHAFLPGSEVIAAFEDIKPRVLRDDFALKGISFDNKPMNIQSLYWTALKWRDEAEANSLKNTSVYLELPSEASISTILHDCLHGDYNDDNISEIPAASTARLMDLAFDVAVERSEFFLLGHGRARKDRTAYRHQISTAKRIIEDMYGVGIVSDEVGLGKTIVAGLIIEDLLEHEPAANILILVPYNLRTQWAIEQLPDFFGRIVPSDFGNHITTLQAAAKAQILLFALDQAKGDGKGDVIAKALMKRSWDLLILDEAHDCKNANTLRFRFVYSLRARRRLFLTATPLHNSGYDVFSLATLLKPGCLGSQSSFSENYMRGKQTISDSNGLQESLFGIMTRTRRKETGLPFAKRKFKTIKVTEFLQQEKQLYDELLSLLQGVYQRQMGASAQIMRPSLKEQHVSQFVLISMLVLREIASHPLSVINTLEKALRERVLEFARLTRDDSDLQQLDEFIKRYKTVRWDETHHSKSGVFLKEVEGLLKQKRKFIVFVNYLATHRFMVRLLKRVYPELTVLGYSGTLGKNDKDQVIEQFRDKSLYSCLISTDAGGQGLNLQDADCVVNYDYPWNPMRMEQRIGRVDRASQASKEISVLNFRTLGTVEEYVQIVLTTKLKECRAVLGDFSSPLEIEKIYEDKLTMGIGRALMESVDADDMRLRMNRLGESELNSYVGEYAIYEKQTPKKWTWQPRD